jgi:hypothetical protein
MIPQAISGQKFRFPAEQFNQMADVVNRARSSQLNGGIGSDAGGGTDSTLVLVRNDSGSSQERFAILGIDEPIIGPSDSLADFQGRVALACSEPDAATHSDRIVILQQPIAAGGFGLGVVSGASVVQIDVQDEDDTHAALTDGDATQLTSNTTGPHKILWKDSGTGTVWGIVRIAAGQTEISPDHIKVRLASAIAGAASHRVVVYYSGWSLYDSTGGGYSRPGTIYGLYVTDGTNHCVYLFGLVPGFSSLSTNEIYYANGTGGEISTSSGDTVLAIGQAISTSEIIFEPQQHPYWGSIEGTLSAQEDLQDELDALADLGPPFTETVEQSSHGFSPGYVIHFDESSSEWAASKADAKVTARVDAIVLSVEDPDNFTIARPGYLPNGIPGTTGILSGEYLSQTNAGYTIPEPSSGISLRVLSGLNTVSLPFVLLAATYRPESDRDVTSSHAASTSTTVTIDVTRPCLIIVNWGSLEDMVSGGSPGFYQTTMIHYKPGSAFDITAIQGGISVWPGTTDESVVTVNGANNYQQGVTDGSFGSNYVVGRVTFGLGMNIASNGVVTLTGGGADRISAIAMPIG